MARHFDELTADGRARPESTQTERRIRAEYGELPGLCLTTDQAMRLWTLDRSTCETTLEHLAREGILERDDIGRYARAASASPCGKFHTVRSLYR